MPRPLLCRCLLLLLSALPACKPSPPPENASGPAAATRWSFPGGVVFAADFPGARLTECAALGEREFGLVIRPENLPVNNSPWFFFQVTAAQPAELRVRLRCQGGSLRYLPKISTDGVRWVPLPEECYQQAPDAKEALLRLEAGPEPLWVAAQEPVSTQELHAWTRTLERLPFVTHRTFGASRLGTSLVRLDIGAADAPRKVVVIGRQHPPETTGSQALMRFVEEIVGDSEAARAFRADFHLVVMPLLNPDGVDAGHWRHNLGRTDLNRDWKDFAQPETRSVREEILALQASGRLFLLLDFHSTFKDVFYTQADDAPSLLPDFTRDWLADLQARVPDYQVERSASPVPTPTTSTYWAHHTFGIPAITYEIGDHTERSRLRQIAAVTAQGMMRLLLENKDAVPMTQGQ